MDVVGVGLQLGVPLPPSAGISTTAATGRASSSQQVMSVRRMAREALKSDHFLP